VAVIAAIASPIHTLAGTHEDLTLTPILIAVTYKAA